MVIRHFGFTNYVFREELLEIDVLTKIFHRELIRITLYQSSVSIMIRELVHDQLVLLEQLRHSLSVDFVYAVQIRLPIRLEYKGPITLGVRFLADLMCNIHKLSPV